MVLAVVLASYGLALEWLLLSTMRFVAPIYRQQSVFDDGGVWLHAVEHLVLEPIVGGSLICAIVELFRMVHLPRWVQIAAAADLVSR